jgi:hypothetical protein
MTHLPLATAGYRAGTNSITIHAATFRCATCGAFNLLSGRKMVSVGGRKVYQCRVCVAAV